MPEYTFTGPFIVAIGRQTPEGVRLLGTGFGIQANRIATAAHVVGPSDSALVAILPPIGAPAGYQDTTNTEVRQSPLTIVAFDAVRDIAIVELTGLEISGKLELKSTDSVSPGSPVVTHGYPHADTGRLVLTQHAALVGAKILLGNSAIKTKHIVLNIQTRPGQSGSPVFSEGAVCAMVVGAYRPEAPGGINLGGIDPATLHQTTHAVSAEYIQEMIK